MKAKVSVLDARLHAHAGRAPAGASVTIKLLVRAMSEPIAAEWVRKAGGKVRSRHRGVLVVDLPVAALHKLEHEAWVRRAEAPRTMIPFLDECRSITGLDAALEVRSDLTGKGVVIGIIDTGLDWKHRDFRTREGRTRVETFIHATRSPNGAARHRLFRRTDIDASLRNGNGRVPAGDAVGHGTHCASIAAGNGNALPRRKYRGVASEATLIAMRCDSLDDDHVIWGINRIFKLAGKRPAVINISLGAHHGAHDGTSAIERAISRESGRGRIVVVAAGNEAIRNLHWQGQLVRGRERVIPCVIRDPNLQHVDVWIPRGDEVDILIETPDGKAFRASRRPRATPFGRFTTTFLRDPINLEQNLFLEVENAGAAVNRTWKIRLRALSVSQGDVHAWAGTPDKDTAQDLFPDNGNRAYSIAMPATEERAIAVASWVSRTTYDAPDGAKPQRGMNIGQLAGSSSGGPTRCGILKPDIAAPGQYITAALAESSMFATDPGQHGRRHPSGRYITKSGTSAAAPFVTGVVALMLQRDPDLTPEEVQQRLRITARRDAQTGRVWNSGYGFGKIDVAALLDHSEMLGSVGG